MNPQKISQSINSEKISTSFNALDKALLGGFSNTDLVILGARPAMGKTSFALSLVENLCLKNKKTVAIFSLELSKEKIIQKMLSMSAEIDIAKFKTGNFNTQDWKILANKMKDFSETNIFIDDNCPKTIYDIRDNCLELKSANKDLALIIIDYLQLIENTNEDDDYAQQLDIISKELKLLAEKLKTPILVLSQVSRAVEERDDKRPKLSDLRYTSSFKENADIILFLYREDYYNQTENNTESEAEIIIAKNKHYPISSPAKLKFKKNLTKFEDIEN